MIHFYRGEEFKEIILEPRKQLRYAISNQGRLVSFTDDIKSGRELKGGVVGRYKIFHHQYQGNGIKIRKSFLFSRLVAQYFLPKGNKDQSFVLHLDYDKQNNCVENLKWANQKELIEHHRFNPLVIKGKEKTTAHNIKADGRKLTSTQVIRIKKMLQRQDNRTRFVMIAKQFNITTQQLYRIRTGENWGHIKV